MHMADALLSPAVGLTGWMAALGLVAVASRKVARRSSGAAVASIPLAGVMGAFVFSAQMLNVSIPGTGSSGHLGGGLLLAALLGPWPAFLIMASILALQALFFADGGLLAWGCNVLNLGAFPCLVAWPLVFGPLARGAGSTRRSVAAVLGALVALELGALGVVLETTLSGVTALPFTLFAGVMLPIHAVIGLVEGLATASILGFLARVEPGLVPGAGSLLPAAPSRRWGLPALGIAAVLTAGVFSWFASSRPDGLEWSVARVAGSEAIAAASPVHTWTAGLQEAVAIWPDYDSPQSTSGTDTPDRHALRAGTSTAGLAGAAATLALIGLAGAVLRRLGRLRDEDSARSG